MVYRSVVRPINGSCARDVSNPYCFFMMLVQNLLGRCDFVSILSWFNDLFG